MEYISIYWDFENIHASLFENANGSGSYHSERSKPQPCIVNVEAIMNFILPMGPIAINRAYANWIYFSSYTFILLNYSLDLIQLFPRGYHAKNGADIRMCVDIIEDTNIHSHIGKIVIIGGDSDYISVGQKLRQKGKEVIGIGVRETTNRFWISACNQFKYYDNLLMSSLPSASATEQQITTNSESDISDAKKTLVDALTRINTITAEPFARMSALKQTMLQLDPSFDELTYGYRNFSKFLDEFNDIIKVQQGPYEKHVFFLEKFTTAGSIIQSTPLEEYKRILRQQQYRLPPGNSITPLCNAVCLANEHGLFASWEDFLARVKASLPSSIKESISDADLSRMKLLLFRNRVFQFNPDNKNFSLLPLFSSSSNLAEHIFINTIQRLINQPNLSWDPKIASQLLYGNDQHENEVNEIYKKLYKV